MPCNAICMPQYQCGPIQKIQPQNSAVYAPFVILTLGDVLTVGNNSYPGEPNTAVIKSMDYGGSDGAVVTIEIIDEAGTTFQRYFESVSKDICVSSSEYNMQLDFGWLSQGYDGTVTRIGIPDGPIHFLPKEIESSYEGGVIKYTLKGTDLMSHMGENRINTPIGTEANKVRLAPAMRQLLSRNCPQINSLQFKRRTGNGWSNWFFRNSDGGPDGPMSVWPPDQQHALGAIRKWANSVTTDRGLGFTPVWNSGSSTPELWLVEDARQYCDQTSINDNGSNCIGTYIVNGGDCSPVISFSPQAKWVLSADGGSGGNLGGGSSARTIINRPIPGRRCQSDKSPTNGQPTGGTTSQFPASQNDMNWRSPDLVTQRMQEALAAQESAAQYPELSAPIEAELKVWGDPKLVHPYQWVNNGVGIIVINPFNIFSGPTSSDWLAGPMCNPIYSDRNWMITGVNHQISEGSYTTTIKVAMNNLTKNGGA